MEPWTLRTSYLSPFKLISSHFSCTFKPVTFSFHSKLSKIILSFSNFTLVTFTRVTFTLVTFLTCSTPRLASISLHLSFRRHWAKEEATSKVCHLIFFIHLNKLLFFCRSCNLLQFVAICCSREEGSVHREKIVWTENYRDVNISITALIFYVQSVFTISSNKRYISCLVAFPELKSINLNLIKKELNTKRTYNYFSYFIISFRLLLPFLKANGLQDLVNRKEQDFLVQKFKSY